MSTLLDRFKKNVIGSSDTIHDYLSVISSTGDFKRITKLNVILNSWNNILLTPRGTYLHDPNFGSVLYKYVFEPSDSDTVEDVKRETVDTLLLYDDRASIDTIRVLFQNNGKRMSIYITASYKGEKGTLEAKFDDTTYADFLSRTAE